MLKWSQFPPFSTLSLQPSGETCRGLVRADSRSIDFVLAIEIENENENENEIEAETEKAAETYRGVWRTFN